MRGLRSGLPRRGDHHSDDLTPENEVWKDIAISFFAQVGDPGGASALGPTGFDEPRVAALPGKS